MGIYDSTKTRVIPTFKRIISEKPEKNKWLDELIFLPSTREGKKEVASAGVPTKNDWCYYGDGSWNTLGEKKLAPPVSLLSWLIRNLHSMGVDKTLGNDETSAKRRGLIDGNTAIIEEALGKIRHGHAPKQWYVLEGYSQPDVFIETDEAIIVIEGKRTENGPTTKTTWMPGRHQMLRHIDNAWEIRGRRKVYGFFLVESCDGICMDVPAEWYDFADQTISAKAIAGSLPHRSQDEARQIANCFLGVATWQKLVDTFELKPSEALPDQCGS